MLPAGGRAPATPTPGRMVMGPRLGMPVAGVPGGPVFLMIGIRLRFPLSVSLFGLVSFSTGNSILPIILGPTSLVACMLVITGGASVFGSSLISAAAGSTSFTTGTGATVGSGATCGFAGSAFLLPFFGLVLESMADRSIFEITLGPSSSGASTLVITSFCSVAGAVTSSTGAAATDGGTTTTSATGSKTGATTTSGIASGGGVGSGAFGTSTFTSTSTSTGTTASGFGCSLGLSSFFLLKDKSSSSRFLL